VKKFFDEGRSLTMKLLKKIPVLGRLIEEDKGQALVFTAVILTAFIGVTGVAVDAGKGYYAYELLKESTNAAALAGAGALPDTTAANTYAIDYGSKSAEFNSNGIMSSVTTTPSFGCWSAVTTYLNTACEPPPGVAGVGNNAIQVIQTAKVSTWIGPLFGMPTFSIQAVSSAAMRGGAYIPYNIAVVIDTTKSMLDADDGNNSGCSNQEQCALNGFKDLLEDLYPCQSSGTCNSSDNTVDNVSLFVFPVVQTAGVSDDSTCTSNYPAVDPYTFTSNTAPTPNSSASNMALLPSTDSYEIVNFENGYKTTDAGSTLVASDPLAIASGVGGTNCGILKTVNGQPFVTGGVGTYYAQVIYQAQAVLYNESNGTNGNGFKNAMVILSDGDATANGSSEITTSTGGGTLNGTGTHTTNPNGYESYAYPSALGECGQAVIAAQQASAAGTTVYTIGYGTETTGSCTYDKTYSATVSGSAYGANGWAPGDQACSAIGAMATNANDFYSDNANGCAAVAPSLAGLTSLANIFHSIANNFSTARLIPNSWS
jgi:Flp pilus assembly protein TadG